MSLRVVYIVLWVITDKFANFKYVIAENKSSFRCDYKYSSAAKGWFKYIDVPANWADARLRCTLEGAVLASPSTRTLKAEMKIHNKNSTKNKRQNYDIFTGIHATISNGDYYTIDGTPLSQIQRTWARNEPDNKGNKESCLTMNSNGELADINCEKTRPYICYRSETTNERVNECGTIDPEYSLDNRTNSCYKFHVVARNFSRAFFTCSAEGGHLAIINSETEATVLRELFAKYPASKMVGTFWKDVAFVGFHDWGEQWDYRTVHGQTLTEAGYNKFSGGEPNNFTPGEHCGAIYRSALLDDLWCDRPAPFICEKNPDYPEVCHVELVDNKNIDIRPSDTECDSECVS